MQDLWDETLEKEEENTSILMKVAQKELVQLEKILKKIEEFWKNAPDGTLKVQNKGENTYFYQQCWIEHEKYYTRKYIKKENLFMVKELAQKQYYTLVQPVLKNQLEILKSFIEQYRPEEYKKIYQNLSRERKRLVTPILWSREEKIQQWKEEKYEKNKFYAENLRYETEQGDLVRSKSEVIIANILYQHRENILYKYERPLEVRIEGRVRTIYPDFTILNLHTGKIIYLEHAGKMDDSQYVNEFVKKVNIYVENGILPGKDVVFTYETIENPLEIGVIKKIIEEIENREI